MTVSAGFLSIVGLASAQTLTYTGMNRSDALTGTVTLDGNSKNVYIGAINFTDGTNSLMTYCADLASPLNGSGHNYNLSSVDFGDVTGLGLAARIVAIHYDVANTADKQAGLQLAVWSALYDNGASFSASGVRFQVNSGVNANALNFASTYYLAGVSASPTNSVDFYATAQAGGQSQLHAVPEPASMAVLALGVAGVLRRRSKK